MYQSLTIIGHLGKEPEMRYTPSGQAVTSFNVATNREYTNDAGTKVKETTWFRVAAWGKLAEICNQFLHKGSMVLVEGRLTADTYGNPRIWTDDKGTARANFEMTASTVRFLSSNPGTAEPAEPESEIPF